MFELEAGHTHISSTDLPTEIQTRFKELDASIEAISLLNWEEHCTECAMPACFQSCDLYQPRKDGKCRRFAQGIEVVDGCTTSFNPIVKIEFKRWGKLMAQGHLRMALAPIAINAQQSAARLEHLGAVFPDSWLHIAGRKAPFTRVFHRRKMALLANTRQDPSTPELFRLDCFNPATQAVKATLEFRAKQGPKNPTPFLQLLTLQPGFNRVEIPFPDIAPFLEPEQAHLFTVTPNHTGSDTVTLYFGNVGFVRQQTSAAETSHSQIKTVKVAVWDLDNTIWQGVLVEDGADQLSLISGIDNIIKTLDQRGIVNSIASKNDPKPALALLEKFGLRDYFVFPQISWHPKSQALKQIIADFNVGADTVAFIDDAPFEREEVASSVDKIRVYDALDYQTLLDRPEFNPEISSESSRRREFYLNQKKRSDAQSGFDGDYLSFLRNCQIELDISTAKPSEIQRIHELVQRTNQLNFSGTRYTLQQLEKILNDPDYDCYSLHCNDKFGDYGTVGFAIINNVEMTLVDMMLSCRVQSKQVERSFLLFLFHHYRQQGHTEFRVRYQKTERNTPAGAVFEQLDFTIESRQDTLSYYHHALDGSLPWDTPLTVSWEGSLWHP